jgi:hypothetical protein
MLAQLTTQKYYFQILICFTRKVKEFAYIACIMDKVQVRVLDLPLAHSRIISDPIQLLTPG